MALFGTVHAFADEPAAEKAAIRTLIGKTWDKPEAKVVVDPIAVDGEHAIAGWTQGERGGRALLRKRGAAWAVVLCSGDALKEAAVLIEAGVPEASARRLASDLAAAEQATDQTRVQLFSTFDGLVRMDGGATGGHQPHHR
jgi:hypothetical protein